MVVSTIALYPQVAYHDKLGTNLASLSHQKQEAFRLESIPHDVHLQGLRSSILLVGN